MPCPFRPTIADNQCSPSLVITLHFAGKNAVVVNRVGSAKGLKTCECKRSVVHVVVELHVV